MWFSTDGARVSVWVWVWIWEGSGASGLRGRAGLQERRQTLFEATYRVEELMHVQRLEETWDQKQEGQRGATRYLMQICTTQMRQAAGRRREGSSRGSSSAVRTSPSVLDVCMYVHTGGDPLRPTIPTAAALVIHPVRPAL